MSKLVTENWGEIPYAEAFEKQNTYVNDIVSGNRPETLVFCTHPPVVTLGRGTKEGDVFSWQGEVVEVNRGGRATYHGPSQIVFYPLIYLGDPSEQYQSKKIPSKDLHAYLRAFESSMVELLELYDIKGEGHTIQQQVGEDEAQEATGVWVNNQKIASIGIAVRKWVTMHGAALNIYHDPKAFQGMNPCGFQTQQMTNMETLRGDKISREDIQNKWLEIFLKHICD